MRRISVRNLAAHKVRLVLTVISVVLGTAFIAGSFVFTDSLKSTFNKIVDVADKGVDVKVTPRDSDSPGVPMSVVNSVSSVPGVRSVQLDASGPAVLIGSNGKRVQTGGAPSIATMWNDAAHRVTPPPTWTAGGPPTSAGQVAINKGAAKKAHLNVGDHTKVVLNNRGVQNVTITGIYSIDTQTGGFVDVMFSRAQGLSLLTDGQHVESVSIAGTGVSEQALRDRVASTLSADMQAKTGDQVRKDDRGSVASSLSFVNYFLLAFGFIALLAGTFIIYNTFSMLIAQRSRELALLRAIGGERRQVTRAVLYEASIIGVVGSVLGIAGGVGLAFGLRSLLDAIGSGLPGGSLSVLPRTIIVALIVGTVVTLLSAWAPARRAGRTAPVAAMRDDATPTQASLRRRSIIGGAVAALGIVAAVAGATASSAGSAAGLLGLGLLGVGAGVLLLAPVLAKSVIGALGALVARPFGPSGKLARTNAVRNPRRTAATAFSLTIGLMLVAGIAVVGSSMKKSVADVVDNTVKADYIVSNQGQGGLPAPAARAAEKASGVGSYAALHNVTTLINGKKSNGIGADGNFADMATFHWVQGSGTATGTNLIASKSAAKSHHWTVGQRVTLTAPDGPSATVTVVGIYKDNALLNPWIVSDRTWQTLTPSDQRSTDVVLVKAAPGTSQATLRTSLENAEDPYYIAQVQNRQEFKGQVAGYVNNMLSILYALLGLAIIIAILGVINTLALSVVERRREIGMLRAVGMQRRQVRRTIRLESMLIALFGAVLGVGIGLTFGTLFARTLRDQGLKSLSVPWTQAVLFLVLAAVVGVLAALWPAAKAARTKPLDAIAEV